MRLNPLLKFGAGIAGGTTLVTLCTYALAHHPAVQDAILREHAQKSGFDPTVLLKNCKGARQRYLGFRNLMRLNWTEFVFISQLMELGWPVDSSIMLEPCYTCSHGLMFTTFRLEGHTVQLHEDSGGIRLATFSNLPEEMPRFNPRYEDFCRHQLRKEPKDVRRF